MLPQKKPSHGSRLALASYLPVGLLFFGIMILLLLIFYHIGHNTVSLSNLEKYIFAGSIVLAIMLVIVGLLLGTTVGTLLLSRRLQVSVDDTYQIRAQKWHHAATRMVLLALFATIYFAYLDEKLAVFNLDATSNYNDTENYLLVSSHSLFDIHFWTGIRSFGLPLFYKAVGYKLSNFLDPGNMNHVSRIQWNIAVVCWTILAVTVCLAMKKWLSRILSFLIILMLGASVDISFWDRSMLSESLATSLFVLLLSLLILAGLLMESRRRLHGWVQAIMVGSILLVAICYTFIRDTNAYFLFFLAGFMLVGLFFRAVRKASLFHSYLVVAIGFLLIFWLGHTTANIGKRFLLPLLHVFVYRYIPEEQSRNFFIARGVPFDDRIASAGELSLTELKDKIAIDPSFKQLGSWFGEDGERVSVQYLVSHPGYFLFAPLNDVQRIVNGSNTKYRTNISPTPARIVWLSAITYLRFDWLPILFLVIALACLGLVFERSNRGRIIWVIVLVLFLTAYPLSLIVWHGDTIVIERHSLQVAVQLRLAFWIFLVLCVERVYSLGKRFYTDARKKEPNNLFDNVTLA